MKKNSLKHFIIKRAFIILLIAVLWASCKPAQQTTQVPQITETTVSYARDIAPIMQRSCTPCHFPEEGRKKMLDTFTATSKNIHDIIARIELPPSDPDYMPFKSKKPEVTPEEVKLFKTWMSEGMPE